MSLSLPLFSTDRTRVVMTGFAPFLNYETNPSWEAVKVMNGDKIEKKYNITLFRKEIAVSYDAVDDKVPQMWEWYQPDLTIHVGLDETVQSFVLEKRARKRDYITLTGSLGDIENPAGEADVVYTNLDVEAICSKFNRCQRKLPDPELHAKASVDAGQFVCEYIYYTSLCQEQSPTLFVHVPFTTYSRKQLAQGLERILELCLKQLPKHNDNNPSNKVLL